VIDETAVLFDTVMVSGGKVGVQVELSPADLLAMTQAETAEITREDN
jgi:Cys-tRNA(Pro)/Cys-tRNA(Cys) deacylase